MTALLQGAAAEFYEPRRWIGWEAEIARIEPDQGLSLIPPPFTSQGANIAGVSRRPVPFTELLAFYDEVVDQVRDLGPGESFRFSSE